MRRSTVRPAALMLAAALGGLVPCLVGGPPAPSPELAGTWQDERAPDAAAPPPGSTAERGQDAPATVRPEDVPVPDGVAAMVDDDIVISLDEYKDYLLAIYGARPLDDLIYLRLLERASQRSGVAVDDAEVAAAVEDKWRQLLDLRHQGRLEDLVRELADAGYTPDGYRASLRVKERIAVYESHLALAQREVTEAQLRERFERDFGTGGVRVEVRHIYLNRARMKADLIRAGADATTLDNARLDAALAERAGDLLAQLNGGADFEALARAHSHDLSVQQNGGFIPGYNYRRYGEPMALAVRAAEVGVPTGPVSTQSGLHLIEVTERTQTDFDAVRDELAATLAAEPVSWKERGDLRARLFAGSIVRTY